MLAPPGAKPSLRTLANALSSISLTHSIIVFFFNDTATTEIYTLSLHDALPISRDGRRCRGARPSLRRSRRGEAGRGDRLPGRRGDGADSARRRLLDGGLHRLPPAARRSEEHTSELQSLTNLVCRLLLEKKKIVL